MSKSPGKLDVKSITDRFEKQNVNIQKPDKAPVFKQKPKVPAREKPVFKNQNKINVPVEPGPPTSDDVYDDVELEQKPAPPRKPAKPEGKLNLTGTFLNKLESQLNNAGPLSPPKPKSNLPPTFVQNRNEIPNHEETHPEPSLTPRLPPRLPERQADNSASKLQNGQNSRAKHPLPPIPPENIQRRRLPDLPNTESTKDRFGDNDDDVKATSPPHVITFKGERLPPLLEIGGRRYALTPLLPPKMERAPKRPPRPPCVVVIVPNEEYITSGLNSGGCPRVAERGEAHSGLQQRNGNSTQVFANKIQGLQPSWNPDEIYDDTDTSPADPLYEDIVMELRP